MSKLIFQSFIFSYLSAWIISKIVIRKSISYVMFFIFPVLSGLIVATIDPPNSTFIFFWSTFINFLLTPFCFFIFFRNEKIEVPRYKEVILPGDLEEKFQRIKKWFIPIIIFLSLLCMFFLYLNRG
jgi:hypothetical protein